MRSLCQAEYRARDELLKVVANVDCTLTDRLRALGLSSTGIAKVRALTNWRDPHTTPAGLDAVSPWFRIAVQRAGSPGGSSGLPIGDLNGWTVLVWTL